MSEQSSARALLVAALGAIVVLAASSASASHYRLPADGLVTEHEHALFRANGVSTTLELFEKTAPLAERKQLALKTGVTVARLTELACQSDLLRVSGVGPSMVKLLQSAGIMHTRDLRAATSADLETRLRVANKIHRVAPVLPSAGVLEDWIAQATRLDQIIEGVK